MIAAGSDKWSALASESSGCTEPIASPTVDPPLRSQVAIDRLAVLTVAALMEFRKSGLPEQYERPDHRNVELAHEYRRAANIFCALGQLMML